MGKSSSARKALADSRGISSPVYYDILVDDFVPVTQEIFDDLEEKYQKLAILVRKIKNSTSSRGVLELIDEVENG